MDIEFDPDKDRANIAKHGISLARADDFEVHAYAADNRFAEPRFRLYGFIDGLAYCLAGTDRDGVIRVISLRRVHQRRCGVMSNDPIVSFDDDNPEWTEADFARAKRGDDIPAHIRAAFPKRGPGRPAGTTTSAKQQVTLRLDKDALDRLKANGPGWQTRINEAVRKAAGL